MEFHGKFYILDDGINKKNWGKNLFYDDGIKNKK
jgi:hypothetical protein